MRKNLQKLINLDQETWELALVKTNFSQWVRGQLRSERNKGGHERPKLSEMTTERIQFELDRRNEE
jgi:hypothetical protein